MRRDLAIVGGGPAGIATALFLQRHDPRLAERTVVLEKARYPRDKYCAGAIGGRALEALRRIGVEPEVPTVRIHGISLRLPDTTVAFREADVAVVVRRIQHDHALARIATSRGIEVRDGTPVERLEPTARGVRLHLGSGDVLETKAVVGADGVGGVVRRSAGLPGPRLRAQVAELDTEPVAGDPPSDTLHFDLSKTDLCGYAWDFPTPVDGRVMWCRGVYAINSMQRDDVRGRTERYLADKGLSLRDYRLKRYAERGFEPTTPIAVPRVLLVGEAAGIDIATGEGIAQAVEYGELAGRYLAEAFARGDFAFSDWRQRVLRSQAGVRLCIRYAAHRLFYASERPATEQLLGAGPDLSRLAAQDFAGKPIEPRALARCLAQLALPAARYVPGLGLRTVGRRARKSIQA